ncbi:hypothetical protein ACOMHN_006545 [Nucella lapillus]
MELESLSHTHTQLSVDALTTLGLLRCYGLEFGSPKVGTAGSGGLLIRTMGNHLATLMRTRALAFSILDYHE